MKKVVIKIQIKSYKTTKIARPASQPASQPAPSPPPSKTRQNETATNKPLSIHSSGHSPWHNRRTLFLLHTTLPQPASRLESPSIPHPEPSPWPRSSARHATPRHALPPTQQSSPVKTKTEAAERAGASLVFLNTWPTSHLISSHLIWLAPFLSLGRRGRARVGLLLLLLHRLLDRLRGGGVAAGGSGHSGGYHGVRRARRRGGVRYGR